MLFVVNPSASGGEVGRGWPKVESWLRTRFEDVEVSHTTGPGSATGIVRAALLEGEEEIAVVGGDGTVNEAVNGFIEGDKPIRPGSRLTIIPVGSGCDYAKTLELPRGLANAELILESEQFRAVDVGRARYRNLQGATETRYFANILEAGVGGAVVDKVNRSSKLLGGRAAFLWAILTTLPSYRNRVVEVKVDEEVVATGPMNSVIVANGRYYGSGLKPAPEAEVDDGIFDVVLIGDVRFGEAVSSLRKLRKGEHLRHPKVTHLRGTKVEATSKDRVLAEMDGELVGTLPMGAVVLPRLLQVRVLSG
ncbi:MAG: diacylglycerol/lipid kinase family protein [Thermoplasmata archaeon]